MKTLEQTIREELNEKFNVENCEVEILDDTLILIDGIEKYQVVDENTAIEILGDELRNFDGFKAQIFDFEDVTYYFVKQ
jgi:hypothetical protein